MLVGFESVSKYLERRNPFFRKTAFWESLCKSDDCVSMEEAGISWNDLERSACSQLWALLSHGSFDV